MKPYTIITTSWDDGHIHDLKLAELLKKYSLSATFYISPKNREWSQNELLTESHIKELSTEFEIGAHTMTHPELINVSVEEAEEEIRDSKTYLEDLLGKEVPMFCYPRGLFNYKIKRITKEVGFNGARTTQAFRITLPTDPFEMGTTHHTVDRSKTKNLVYSLLNNGTFFRIVDSTDWLEFGKRSLDIVENDGGIWHLWSHSWQIEQYDWWDKLEELLQYAANKKTSQKLTNGDIITQSNMSNTTHPSY